MTEWIDNKTGRTYWRVRWNDATGKESVKVFGTPEEAETHATMISKACAIHGRAAAVSADEIAALSVWREYVAGELTAGRDGPSLRDAIRSTIERLALAYKVGKPSGRSEPKDGGRTTTIEQMIEHSRASPEYRASIVATLKAILAGS